MRKIITIAVAERRWPLCLRSPPSRPQSPPTRRRPPSARALGWLQRKGTLVSQNLAQTAGVGTATRATIVGAATSRSTIKKANHKVTTSSFDVTNIKVRWYDANHDGTA